MEEPPKVEIFLANASATYSPGQIITGRVVVTTSSEEEVRGIIIKLIGLAIVDLASNFDSEDSEDDQTTHADTAENSYIYVDMQNFYRLGQGEEERGQLLPRGDSSYPFQFRLPETNLPCNFKGKYGQVQYFVKAIVQRSYWKVDVFTIKWVHIVPVVNFLEHICPSQVESIKTLGCCCFMKGLIVLKVLLKQTSFFPGDKISFEVVVDNTSTKHINNVVAKLKQHVKYVGKQTEKVVESILKVKKWGECVCSREQSTWYGELELPYDLVPTGLGGCSIIQVNYNLQMEAYVFGMRSNLKADCEILIATRQLTRDASGVEPVETDSSV